MYIGKMNIALVPIGSHNSSSRLWRIGGPLFPSSTENFQYTLTGGLFGKDGFLEKLTELDMRFSEEEQRTTDMVSYVAVSHSCREILIKRLQEHSAFLDRIATDWKNQGRSVKTWVTVEITAVRIGGVDISSLSDYQIRRIKDALQVGMDNQYQVVQVERSQNRETLVLGIPWATTGVLLFLSSFLLLLRSNQFLEYLSDVKNSLDTYSIIWHIITTEEYYLSDFEPLHVASFLCYRAENAVKVNATTTGALTNGPVSFSLEMIPGEERQTFVHTFLLTSQYVNFLERFENLSELDWNLIRSVVLKKVYAFLVGYCGRLGETALEYFKGTKETKS